MGQQVTRGPTAQMLELRCSLKPAAALQANALSKPRLTSARDIVQPTVMYTTATCSFAAQKKQQLGAGQGQGLAGRQANPLAENRL